MQKYKESFYNIPIKRDNNGRTLVYNSNTTALSWFTPEVYNTFHDKNDIDEKDLISDIIRLGFVVDNELDEVSKIEFERQKFLFNETPKVMHYIIAPTMTCNMSCTYCFENGSNCNATMTHDDCNKVLSFIIKQLESNPNVMRLYILWFGGEPSLAQDIIKHISKKLIEYTKSHNIKFHSTIISNGLLLDKELAKTFKNECNIRFAQITLDGLAETYAKTRKVSNETFYKVIDNIVDINDILGVSIRINVSHDNKNEVKSLIKYLLECRNLNGKVEIYLANVREYDSNENSGLFSHIEFQRFKNKMFNELVEEGFVESIQHSLRERSIISCGSMQMTSATIGPDLNLYRCPHCLGKPEYIIGSCEKGFYRNEIDSMFINHLIPDKCKKCKYFPSCATGCREEQVLQKRSFDCEVAKLRIRTSISTYMAYNDMVKGKKIEKIDLFEPC